ncbi:thiamine phosphate synthase [Vibrio neonatus]|uniref:thiamine phosphate synthase n=1 Tax=Vibrio neonatus TaxID=278860 RepID=UPI0021C3032B|nr:thiamine phosphate synthase [Vibrio neonatus]
MESPLTSFIQSPNATPAFHAAVDSVIECARDAGFTNLITEYKQGDNFAISLAAPEQSYNLVVDDSESSQQSIAIYDQNNQHIASITTLFTQGKDIVRLGNGTQFEWDYVLAEYSTTRDSYIAWLLVSLSLGFTIEDSALTSRSAQHVSCETWPSDIRYFPRLRNNNLATTVRKQTRCFGLYPVVDSIELVEELATCGVEILQLRIKDKAASDVSDDVKRAIQIGKERGVDIVINDYWGLALEHGASCIHLGQEDLAELEDSSLLDSDIGLGISTHGYFEIINALQYKPSYLALGHIFPTTTKDMPSSPQGLIKLKLYQALISSIGKQRGSLLPSVAIGGIDLARAPKVIDTGVSSVAVVRAVTLADDKKKAVDQFQVLFNSEHSVDGVTNAH